MLCVLTHRRRTESLLMSNHSRSSLRKMTHISAGTVVLLIMIAEKMNIQIVVVVCLFVVFFCCFLFGFYFSL